MFANCKSKDVVVLDKVAADQVMSLNGANEIFEYVKERRNGRLEKVGVILGQDIGGVVKVSWSKCNFNAGDVFSVFEGLNNCRARIDNGADKKLPASMERQMRQFCSRCFRYFKGVRSVEMV